MVDCYAKKKLMWRPLLVIVYFIINIRVEAGVATLPERMLDGLVACAVLLLLPYIFTRLFQSDPFLSCCCMDEKE
ncbi:hypothetical protein VU05_03255 [Desulfobulbus sp. F1]|nr:hypothetical protein [Desulfobulbus sp. F1]